MKNLGHSLLENVQCSLNFFFYQCQIPIERYNKLLVYKQIFRPFSTYGADCGVIVPEQASENNSGLAKVQRYDYRT